MTTLGLLSDSHGDAATTRAAVQILLDHGADTLIHLGDIGTVQVLDTLAVSRPGTGKQIEAHAVYGNTDWERTSLGRYAMDLGIAVHDPAGLIEVDDRRVAFTHGHQQAVMAGFLADEVDYLLHGHTHVQADAVEGRTRVINPGALHRARRYTAALLTPADGQLTVLEVASVWR